MLILKPPSRSNDEPSQNTVIVNQINSGFNLNLIEDINFDLPVEIEGIEFTPNLSTVESFDWNEKVY